MSAPEKHAAVYILASRRNGTLYTGVTSNLLRRVWEHKNGRVEGFTRNYGVSILVYCEWHDDIRSAIEREKQIKKWRRSWKLAMIERENPEWRDLSEDFPFVVFAFSGEEECKGGKQEESLESGFPLSRE
jgi:putative endonuclease